MAKIDLDGLSIEELAALRDNVSDKLAEKVAARQAELEAELELLSRFGRSLKKPPASPAKASLAKASPANATLAKAKKDAETKDQADEAA